MIVIFGSINIDLIVPVERLPLPGETVLGGDYLLLPGGKGANQALAARRAGAASLMAGAVGTDRFAEIAVAGLRQAGVDVSLVRAVEQPTGCAAIMVARGGENAIAVASGANAMARADQVPDTALGPDTLLVAQMEVPSAETAALIRRVRARGGRSLLNLAPARAIDRAILSDIDFLVANEGEAATLGPVPAAVASMPRRAFVVTRGAAGSTAFLAEGGEIVVPALPIQAVDTTGAGDTFVGVFAAALDAALSIVEALRRASAAAGLACLASGAQTAMPDTAAIDEAVSRLPR